MAVLIFCESLIEEFIPIPGFHAAAHRLRTEGVETLVVDHLARLPLEEFRALCQHLITPAVSTVVLHINVQPGADSVSLYDSNKDPAEVARLNERVGIIRASMRPGGKILGTGWLTEQAEQLHILYTGMDYFYLHGYDICVPVKEIDQGLEPDALPNGVLAAKYVTQRQISGRVAVDYGNTQTFVGNSAYIMTKMDNCVSLCSKCDWEANCTPDSLVSWPSVRPQFLPSFQQELKRNTECCGITNWYIADNRFAADRAQVMDLIEIQKQLPSRCQFFTDVFFGDLCRDPGIVELMRTAGFRGVQLDLPSINPRNMAPLGLPVQDPVRALEKIRELAGPDFCIHATVGSGWPADTVDSLLSDAQYLLSAPGQALVDSFSFIELYSGPKSPLGRSGAYVYPLVGKVTSIGTAYWETDNMTCLDARRVVAEIRQLCRRRKWGYRAWPLTVSIIGEMLSTANIGFDLERAIHIFRTSGVDDQGQLGVLQAEFEQLKTQYFERYIANFLKLERPV